jgi:hypothetical protein
LPKHLANKLAFCTQNTGSVCIKEHNIAFLVKEKRQFFRRKFVTKVITTLTLVFVGSVVAGAKVVLEEMDASHRLIRHGHPLRDAHLVQDDARVDREAGLALGPILWNRFGRNLREKRF